MGLNVSETDVFIKRDQYQNITKTILIASKKTSSPRFSRIAKDTAVKKNDMMPQSLMESVRNNKL